VTWDDSPVTRHELREMRTRFAAIEKLIDAERLRRLEETAKEIYGCELSQLPDLRSRRAELARNLLPELAGLKLPRSQAKSLARRIAARFFGLR